MKKVILLHTISDAFKIERILKNSNINYKLVPTPRELSSDCGVSVIVFDKCDLESLISEVEYDRIEYLK